jgi:integrase
MATTATRERRDRSIHRLAPNGLERLPLGIHLDGGGLQVRVQRSSAGKVQRHFIFRFSSPTHINADGVKLRRDAGFGAVGKVSLNAVRTKAAQWRDKLLLGIDPIDEAEATQAALAATAKTEKATKKDTTLLRLARDYHGKHIEAQRTGKHVAQWLTSIEAGGKKEGDPPNLPPSLLNQPIADIKSTDLLDALLALRARLPETARRVQQRLNVIFADAKLRGLVASNPIADIRSALKESSKDRKKTKTNFTSLPYKDASALIGKLRAVEGTAARALEFAALTAARTGEVIGAIWAEFDLEAKTWTVPAQRMKGHEQHIVYLSERALEILKAVRVVGSAHVFTSPVDPRKPLSNMAMLQTLKRIGYADRTTVHGLRSTFSTWANETDQAKRDVIEACLAHRETDLVRAAYNRATFTADRRALLQKWAEFIEPKNADVRPMRAAQ